MGFYTTSKIISQSLFLFFLGEGGPRGHEHNLYVYATLLTIYIMGYYVITSLIKERINMTSKDAKEIVSSMKSIDSLKAVKISYDLATQNADKITALMKIIHGNVNNINLLAERIAKLEKRLEAYERPQN